MKISFIGDNVYISDVRGDYILPEGSSELGLRYKLENNVVVDMFPDKSDEEVIEHLNQLEEEKVKKLEEIALNPDGWLFLNGEWTKDPDFVETEEILLQRERKIKQQYMNIVQEKLDKFAQERLYDNIFTLCSYANSLDETFKNEGQIGIYNRDLLWNKCKEILEKVKNGEMEIPKLDEFELMLPDLEWSIIT